MSLGNLVIIVLQEVNVGVDRVPGRDGAGLWVQVDALVHDGHDLLLLSGQTISELDTAGTARAACAHRWNSHTKIIVFIAGRQDTDPDCVVLMVALA